MKTNLLFAVPLLFLIACGGNIPSSHEEISSKITVTKDRFKGQTWIESPLYRSRKGFTDTFPVQIKYRALYENNRMMFIQLYGTASGIDWGFFNSAYGVDGTEIEFIDIDGTVNASGGIVTTTEHFALTIPVDYLEKMSQKDWEIKVYGDRREGVFGVPKSLSKAFLNKLNCYQTNSCKS